MKRTTVMVIALLAVFAVVLGIRLFISYEDLNSANPYWNGMMKVSFDDSVRPLYGFSSLGADGAGKVLLIVSPATGITADEALALRSFMYTGGTIVIADDYGAGDSMLDALASPIRIDGRPLCQDESYYKKRPLPIIKDFGASGLTEGVSSLYLNHPSSLIVGEGAVSLARTTGIAWADLDDDGCIEPEEPVGTFSVLAGADIGEGKLVVLSDPDVFLNSMLDMGDNTVFTKNVLNATDVYYDMSHGQAMPPLAALYRSLRYDLVAQALVAALILAAGAVYVKRRSIFPGFYFSPDADKKAGQKLAVIQYAQAKQLLMEKDINEFNKKL